MTSAVEAHTKPIWTGIELMRKYDDLLLEYCTRKCGVCPLSKMCNWDGIIDHGDPAITEEVIKDFVDFSGKAEI